jgi:hypothetical protein
MPVIHAFELLDPYQVFMGSLRNSSSRFSGIFASIEQHHMHQFEERVLVLAGG